MSFTTPSNLIQGPASLFHGAFGVTEPAALTDAFATGWTDLGGTKEGLTLGVNDTFQTLTVDQVLEAVESRRTERVLTIKTSLAEATLENWARALNEAPASAVVSGSFEPSGSFVPTYSALGFNGIAPGGFLRRGILRKCVMNAAFESAYKKDGMTLIPVTFAGHWVSASIRPLKLSDATS